MLSQQNIKNKNDALYSYASGFGDNITDAGSWLQSLFISILLSIFIWQPLTTYILTWIKILAFSWDLRIDLEFGSMKNLFCYVCGCKKPNNDNLMLNKSINISNNNDNNENDVELTTTTMNDGKNNKNIKWQDNNAKLFAIHTKMNLFDDKKTMEDDGENNDDNQSELPRQRSSQKSNTLKRLKSLKKGRNARSGVVLRNDRPMDVLSFFSHDILFISEDHVKENETKIKIDDKQMRYIE